MPPPRGPDPTFDLEVVTTTDTGESTTEVLGVESTAPGGGDPGSGAFVPTVVDAGLAATGFASLRNADPRQLLLLGSCAVVVVAAAGLVIGERRRTRRW